MTDPLAAVCADAAIESKARAKKDSRRRGHITPTLSKNVFLGEIRGQNDEPMERRRMNVSMAEAA
jgi:hypothetical protein